MKIMRVKQQDGSIVDIPIGKGADGKSAYEYAQEGGYSGTEAEFSAILANAVDKRKITLGFYTDGLIYLFIDGEPVGNGVEMSTTAPISAYIDSENNIVLKENTPGALPDGKYYAKLEMEDGGTLPLGELVKDTNVYYSVTKNLTNCTISNSATSIVEGNSYSATISANDGYELDSVSVTMGGIDISHQFEDKGVINIAIVTGNIVITAVATEIQVEPTEPTNFAEPNSTNKTDWSIWCNDARFGSDGAYRVLNGNVVTNYVAMEVGDIIRFEGLNVPTTGTSMNQGLHFSDVNKSTLSASYLSFYTQESNDYLTVTVMDGVYEIDTSELTNHAKAGASKYFRISGGLTGTLDDVVINVKRNGKWL